MGNRKDLFFIISLTVVITTITTVLILLNFVITDSYITKPECENQTIQAYQLGIFTVINYTQATGNIPYINERGELTKTSIADQCQYYNLNNTMEVK